MRNIKTKVLALGLALSLTAGSIPMSLQQVSAASKTYDIAYENGVFTENGKKTEKGLDDYFTVKEIASITDAAGNITGATVTEYTENDKYTTSENHIVLKNSSEAATSEADKRPVKAYVLEFQQKEGRAIDTYEITTSTKSNYVGRPNGLTLPFYYDQENNAYFGFCWNVRSSSVLQLAYVYVGQYRMYYQNQSAEFNILADNSDGKKVSCVTMKISYSYNEDDTLKDMSVAVTSYYEDGSRGTTSSKTWKSTEILGILTDKDKAHGNKDGSGNPITVNVPDKFSKDNMVAGIISANNNDKSTIAGIKVQLSKSDSEYEQEVADELKEELPKLIQAFQDQQSYETAEAYLKAYLQLTDAQKTEYANDIASIDTWLKSIFVNGSTFRMDKSELTDYQNLLEYIWSSESKTGKEYTSANKSLYDMTGVVSTTAVFDKSKLTANTAFYLLTDLVDASDEFTKKYNDFGYVFANTALYSKDIDEHEISVNWWTINANYSNLSSNSDSAVLYKNINGYGKDQWGTDLKGSSNEKKVFSWEENQKYQSTSYIGVEFGYVSKENAVADVPHTEMRLYVKMWADTNGNGICDTDEFVLIQKDRTSEYDYIAIHYLDGAPRKRIAALSADGFKALHSIKMTRELSEDEATFSECYADVLARTPELVEPYDLHEVTDMIKAVETKFGDSAKIHDETLRNTVIALETVHNKWDLTSADTIAESYKSIHFENNELKTNALYAWNVYNRLTADVKEKLSAEYQVIKKALNQAGSTKEQIRIACMGDSLTWGAGSINNSNKTGESYPTYLQSELGEEKYKTTNYGILGTTVIKQDVYKEYANNPKIELNYAETTDYKKSLAQGEEIVIIQLGVNDAGEIAEIMQNDSENANTIKIECLKMYKTGLEEMLQSYFRLESTPFVILSNTAYDYAKVENDNEKTAQRLAVELEIAKINMEMAEKYGIPCVDMYAKTKAYGENYKTYYHTDNLHLNPDGYQDMAKVFASAIQSLEQTYVFEWEETGINSFLNPILKGATLKATTDVEKQGLGFRTTFSTATRTGSQIVEYGTILARYSNDRKDTLLSNMVLENVGNGSYFKGYFTAAEGSELPESYIAGVNLKDSDAFKKVYVARSYVKYSDGTVYYSTNTGDDNENSYVKRTGVLDGFAVRSGVSVLKNALVQLSGQGTDISCVGSVSDGTLTWKEGFVPADKLSDVLDLIVNHTNTMQSVSSTTEME